WGPNDANTWIKTENAPLLHDTNNQPKEAYNALMGMVPESDWGDPKNPAGSTPAAPVEPDENGYYFYSPFETGNDSWSARGSATIAQSSAEAYKGSNSLYVSGRTAAWNGAMKSLNARAFEPGEAYSFSADVKYTTGSASDTFYMKLQYEDASGETQYDSIAEASTVKGEWVQLANTNYTIPAGATNMSVYIETAESTVDFYLDEVVGAVAGTKVEGPGAGSSETVKLIKGDVDFNGVINSFDLSMAKRGLAKGFSPEIGRYAADVDENGTVEVVDVIQLTKFILGKINKFTVAEKPTEPEQPTQQPTTEKPTEQQPTETPGNSVDPTKYMESVRQTMTNSVPASATATNSYGKLEAITYYSKKAEKNKKANVLLPEGYNTNEKYPVLYVNHGIFGDQNSMLDGSMKIRDMAGNLVKSGEAKKMIIVYTSMFTSKTLDQCTGFTLENTIAYDDFLYDLTESLMPYMESNYSVATGRENTAITGFSMGGREALYIGVSRPDVFGYIGAACPAPGVTPGSDSFMNHPGNMQESEFKIKDSRYNPYVFMITGGTNDGVVGTFPQSYHNILTTNGCDHIWQEIQGGGHDASCIVPHMYNFMRNIFKVN
ncbi:MAG: carbohydrate binding domain-containing protein, partial [Oscillospiraceae bacterium]|nr:carbohydrate binding domain-containing protein [Oscillospiraceae bacterium]